MKNTTWWTDNLGWTEALKILSESRRNRYQVSAVRYIGRASALGRWTIALGLFGGKKDSIEKGPWDMARFAGHDGQALFWDVYNFFHRFGWDTAVESGADSLLVESLSRKYSSRHLKFFFRRQVTDECYRLLRIIRFIGAYPDVDPENDHVGLINGHVFTEYLQRYARTYQARIHFYAKSKQGWWGLLRLGRLLWKSISHFMLYLKITVQGWFDPRAYQPVDGKNKVAVYYAQGVEENKRSDLIWFPPSGIDPKNVIVYFLDPHKPPTEAIMDNLSNLGVQAFDMAQLAGRLLQRRFVNPVRYHALLSRKSLEKFFELLALVRSLFGRDRRLKVWQWERTAWLLGRLAMYESFFEGYNVKVHFGFYAEDDQHVIIENMALRQAGGADAYIHWSNHPAAQIYPIHDAYFTWGQFYLPMYREVGHGFKNILLSGYPWDGLFESIKIKADVHRQNFSRRGVKFVLTIFDSIYYEGGWFSKENFIRFHETLLDYVRAHPDVGIIVKAKRRETLSHALSGHVKERLEELEKAGRCLVLSRLELPAEAALASDLVIGYGVFNTAAVESALAKTPAIFFDPSNQQSYPFYRRSGFSTIVYKSFDALTAALIKHKNNPKSIPTMLDLDSLLEEIDPFRDGKTASRLGGYIKVLFNALDLGRTREEALAEANQFYRQTYGDQAVVDERGPAHVLSEKAGV